MTVQYIGNNLYKIDIGYQTIKLCKDEIEEIQDFNFETMEITDGVEILTEEIEILKLKLYEITEGIQDGEIENIDEIATMLLKLI